MGNGDVIINKLFEWNNSEPFSIAFLPYKRAMWDSMQSVYESAVQHNLSAYIMPLPYYTKLKGNRKKYNLDRNYSELLYNVDFLNEMNMDYVVIHNPYDGENSLTEVDSRFWSNKLKTKIVYIPYYILDASPVSLINLPGVYNADYIFLHTENDCNRFRAVLGERASNKKIFASGSPKVDRLFGNHHFNISKVLAEQFFNAPEIVLMVSSVLPFLQDPGTKIKQYYSIITGELNKGNFVIYRPHPLLEDMVQKMCSDVAYGEYMKLVEFVTYNDNCLLDKSNDLAGTISMCSKLISDRSSVITLWKYTGKPYEMI